MAGMTDNILTAFSEGLADAVAAASPSVVQVHGARRAASGVVFAADAIVTTGRAIRTENGVRVRTPDGRMLDAELAGWDPVTHLAVLRVPELNIAAASPAPVRPQTHRTTPAARPRRRG